MSIYRNKENGFKSPTCTPCEDGEDGTSLVVSAVSAWADIQASGVEKGYAFILSEDSPLAPTYKLRAALEGDVVYHQGAGIWINLGGIRGAAGQDGTDGIDGTDGLDSTVPGPQGLPGNIQAISGNAVDNTDPANPVITATDNFLDLTDVSLTSFTEGRVPFETASGLSDSSDLTWDNTNKRLGIGSSIPTALVHATAQVVPTFGNRYLAIDSTIAGAGFEVTDGASGGFLPTFRFNSSGVGGWGGLLMGSIPSANDVKSTTGAAIVLNGRTAANGWLQNADLLKVVNYTGVMFGIDRNGVQTQAQTASHPDPDPGFSSTAALANGDIEVKINVGGVVKSKLLADWSAI